MYTQTSSACYSSWRRPSPCAPSLVRFVPDNIEAFFVGAAPVQFLLRSHDRRFPTRRRRTRSRVRRAPQTGLRGSSSRLETLSIVGSSLLPPVKLRFHRLFDGPAFMDYAADCLRNC